MDSAGAGIINLTSTTESLLDKSDVSSMEQVAEVPEVEISNFDPEKSLAL